MSILPQIARLRLLTCLGVEFEIAYLPHFLDHYLGLGLRAANIHLIANARAPDAPGLAEAKRMLEIVGAPPPHLWIAAYTSDTMWHERRELQRRVAQPGDWILNADIDEHHRYPAPLPQIVAHCEAKGYNAVQGFLIDRLAPEGALQPVAESPALARQFPLEAEVDLSLFGQGEHHGIDSTTKLMLHRGDVFPSRGGHNPWSEGADPRYLAGGRLATHPRSVEPAFRFAFPFRVDHFKWTATRQATFERRIAIPGVSAAGREVGGKMTGYLSRHGRIRLEDVRVRPAGARRGRLGWKTHSLMMRLSARLRARLERPTP